MHPKIRPLCPTPVLALLSFVGATTLSFTVSESAVALRQTDKSASHKTQVESIAAITVQTISQKPSKTMQPSAADVKLDEGMKLYKQGTAESLKAAITKFEEAARLYSASGDRGGEATTLNKIGMIYWSLGEQQKALAYYNQALPLRKVVGDRGVEVATLNNIGLIYNALGENQKALSCYNQSLPLLRAVGNRGGEAKTLNNIGLVYNALGERQKALTYLNQALPLFKSVGDRDGEATTLKNISEINNTR